MQLQHNICMIKEYEVLSIFAERLKGLIDEKEKSMTKFAENIKIPRPTINCWLLKKRCPSIYYLRIIADYFGEPTDYFLGRID